VHPLSNTWSPAGPTRLNILNCILIGTAVRFWTAHCWQSYILQRVDPSPLKIALRVGGLGWAHPSVLKTVRRSVQPFLQGSRSWQTDRQTDRPRTPYVTIDRIYVILRCGLMNTEYVEIVEISLVTHKRLVAGVTRCHVNCYMPTWKNQT